MELTTSMI